MRQREKGVGTKSGNDGMKKKVENWLEKRDSWKMIGEKICCKRKSRKKKCEIMKEKRKLKSG